MGNPRYKNGFALTIHEDLVDLPLRWKKPRIIFTCSMSDIFHEFIPDEFILQLFQVMNQAHWHVFQVLTKRIERAKRLSSFITWTKNIWLGATIEHQRYQWREDVLSSIPAYVRFVSAEPLLGPLNLSLGKIHWVIVGGESGSNARPLKPEWVRSLREQCQRKNVAFFFKQWGGVIDKRGGNKAILDGRLWHQWPHSIKLKSVPF